MKRSIHGMGQIMSTMVLNRKQSIFGGAGARGAGLVLDQRGGKDSIDKMDLTVMDTKLKILEILQVTNSLCGHYKVEPCGSAAFTLSALHQFILNVRLDYRLSFLLSVFKKEFVDVYPMADADATTNMEHAGTPMGNTHLMICHLLKFKRFKSCKCSTMTPVHLVDPQ